MPSNPLEARLGPNLETVVLTDIGDGRTEMPFEQRGDTMTPEQYKAAESGWGGFLDRLEGGFSAA